MVHWCFIIEAVIDCGRYHSSSLYAKQFIYFFLLSLLSRPFFFFNHTRVVIGLYQSVLFNPLQLIFFWYFFLIVGQKEKIVMLFS